MSVSNTKICDSCGAICEQQDVFCGKCGHTFTSVEANTVASIGDGIQVTPVIAAPDAQQSQGYTPVQTPPPPPGFQQQLSPPPPPMSPQSTPSGYPVAPIQATPGYAIPPVQPAYPLSPTQPTPAGYAIPPVQPAYPLSPTQPTPVGYVVPPIQPTPAPFPPSTTLPAEITPPTQPAMPPIAETTTQSSSPVYASTPPVAPTPPPTSRPARRRRGPLALLALLLVLLIVAGAAFAAGQIFQGKIPFLASAQPSQASLANTPALQPTTAPTATPTPEPTLTPTPLTSPTATTGSVLYTEDGTDNWKGWSGATSWKMLNGSLLNDGSVEDSSFLKTQIVAPYQVTGTGNYAVEAKIQLQSWHNHQYTAAFGIHVRGGSDPTAQQGYWAVAINTAQPTFYLQDSHSDFDTSNLAKAAFDPGTDTHTYRVEVKDNSITVFIDGTQKLTVKDNQFLTGSTVGLASADTQMTVTSFKVTAL